MIEISDKRTIGEILADTSKSMAQPVGAIVLGPAVAHLQPPEMALDLSKVQVEKGVPLPPAKTFRKAGSAWLPLLKSMSPGDSVFFAGAKLTQLGYARIIAKKHDFHISLRPRTENGVAGVRLWLTDLTGTDDGLGA
jgi:hypothetical protein